MLRGNSELSGVYCSVVTVKMRQPLVQGRKGATPSMHDSSSARDSCLPAGTISPMGTSQHLPHQPGCPGGCRYTCPGGQSRAAASLLAPQCSQQVALLWVPLGMGPSPS